MFLPSPETLQAVVIAGGESRRMQGQFKGDIILGHQSLLDWTLARLKPQVQELAINTNFRADQIQQNNFHVFSDKSPFIGEGPLAGVYSALIEYPNHWIITVSCDTPFLPKDLVKRMLHQAQITPAMAYFAHDGEREHPLFLLLAPQALGLVTDFLSTGQRKMRDWLKFSQAQAVDFSDQPSSFSNCNTPCQLSKLEHQLTDDHYEKC